MSVKHLGERLKSYREDQGLSLREVETSCGIDSSTLCRIEHGKPVDYDTGKKIEALLANWAEPREWKILYRKCEHGQFQAMVSSHVCREWYVEGPPTGETPVRVREIRESSRRER